MNYRRPAYCSFAAMTLVAGSMLALRALVPYASTAAAANLKHQRPAMLRGLRAAAPAFPQNPLAPQRLTTASTLFISDTLQATQGGFVTIPIIFNSGGNAVTNLAFDLHLDTTALQATLGPDVQGVREVTSVTFPNVPAGYKASVLVQTGREDDLSFFVDLDPTVVAYPSSVPLIPNGVLANLIVRGIGVGTVTTPVTFETSSPPPSAGLSDGSFMEAGITVDNGSVTISPTVQTLNLVPGLNLIGLNVVPAVTTPAAVFGSLGSNLKSVFEYLNCSGFVYYNPTIPSFLNTMTSADIQHGYWLDVNVTGTLQVTGSIPTFPVNIPLCVGSNLIGYPSNGNVTLPGALNTSIPSKWNSVFGEPSPFKFYNPTIPLFLNTLSNMGPGRGYWLDANTAVTLMVTTAAP